MQPRFNSLHISKRALQAHFAGLRKDRDSERVISRIGRQQLTASGTRINLKYSTLSNFSSQNDARRSRDTVVAAHLVVAVAAGGGGDGGLN